jgi:branched-chain amino acid transport system permease protein
MSTFAEILLNGLSLGSVYALIALGFVVIFRATEVVNFAHASLLLAGGYVTAVLHDDIGFWPALLAGIAGAALVGAAVEFLVMRRYRGTDHSVLAIVTIGVDILLVLVVLFLPGGLIGAAARRHVRPRSGETHPGEER